MGWRSYGVLGLIGLVSGCVQPVPEALSPIAFTQPAVAQPALPITLPPPIGLPQPASSVHLGDIGLAFKQTANPIDPNAGVVDLTKIYLVARPDVRVSMVVIAAVYANSPASSPKFVGYLSCNLGDVLPGIPAPVLGTACNQVPSPMIAPRNSVLSALTGVALTANAGPVTLTATPYPPLN